MLASGIELSLNAKRIHTFSRSYLKSILLLRIKKKKNNEMNRPAVP